MSEAGLWELVIIFVLALLILGPERLPVVARKAGYWIGKTRRYINNLKSDVEREFRSDDLEKMLMEQRQEIQNLRTIVSEGREEAQQALKQTTEAINSAADDIDPTGPSVPPAQVESKPDVSEKPQDNQKS